MKRIRFYLATALALGVLSACNNDDLPRGDSVNSVEGDTYMSVTLSMPQGAQTRADNQNQANPDYNNVGKWAGQDEIQKIEVYVFNDGGALEGGVATFQSSDFAVAPGPDNKTNITPKKGIKVTPGQKTVYVVVNPTTESTAYLANKTSSLATFKTAYEGIMDNIAANPNPANATSPLVSTVADKIAKVSNNKDVILMTIAKTAGTVNVEKNVKEAETIATTPSPKNRAKVEVKRAVARVMVTTRAATYQIKGDDATTLEKETEFVIGTLTDIKYVVAQGEKSLYFQQKINEGNENLSIETPNSNYFTEAGNFNAQAPTKYDYSGLWRGYDANAAISGTPVPTRTLYDQVQGTALSKISDDLKAQLHGEFILPNTHTWGATQETTRYRKGNTAYVLVRAKFKPAKVVMADGTINSSYPDNKDFVLGKNGMFYETKEAALDANQRGVAGQTYHTYVKGKMLYYAWVNPDKVGTGWLNSPVLRNNIYHIEITGFKTIGVNWNPLVPNDPNNPNPDPNPDTPDPNTPDPNLPDPEDPLTPSETWMSVETTILPWDVHSYGIEL